MPPLHTSHAIAALRQAVMHPVGLPGPTATYSVGNPDPSHRARDQRRPHPHRTRQTHPTGGESSREPTPLVVNAGLTVPEPDRDPYSTGDTSCPSTAADMGISSPDLEVNTGPGLPQSGGGALTEAPVPVWGSGERKKVVCGSSSQQRSTPEFNSGLVQSDPSYSDSKPPTGSTDPEIIDFLRREQVHGKEVNRSRAEQDQSDPRASRSYLTTVEMIPDHGSHLGYWEEKEIVHGSERRGTSWPDAYYQYHGLKVTFQFHRDIKGANILVGSNNEVKLADFGLAKHIATLTEVHTSCRGTPCWMAPEVILSNCSGKGHNLSADIWSVGCTVIEMAKGKPPLHGYEPQEAIFEIAHEKYIPEIPDVLSDDGKKFLRLCLERTPACRPSAAQLMDQPFIQNQGS